ncbi:hypothetical protein [Haemophilus haemolyticus]|uniref:hypothetical protein n=1 Tax=Haemophilus haemolyticus TaxID=726 RepID=UPI000E57FBBF|nr:hypothetical protein [Haemophilus haemolyticus]
MNDKIKYLEFIQSVITRMSSNSFSLKGWSVTLVSGILALANKDANKGYFLVVYIPVLFFWLLDSYYLHQERLYRALYDEVRKKEYKISDFNLIIPLEINRKNTLISCIFSKTEILFYIPLAFVILVVVFFTR